LHLSPARRFVPEGRVSVMAVVAALGIVSLGACSPPLKSSRVRHRPAARSRAAAPAPAEIAVADEGDPPRTFSREEILAELRGHYSHVSLPADTPIDGVTEYRNVTFVRHGDTDLQLDLFVPAATGPWPGVVLVHGGGWERGTRRMENPFARHLAARGFAVATISYRLGAEGRFPNAAIDVQIAARWLHRQGPAYGVAPTPVGLVGASAGGALVTWVGARPPTADPEHTAIGAVVDIDGLVDFTAPAFVAKESQTPGEPTRFLGGSFAVRGEIWREASALSHVGPHCAPILFINSTAPTPILPGRREMRVWLSTLGIDSQMIVVPDTPHTFWLVEPWFDGVVDATANFLARHLTANSRRSGTFRRP
jgi:acetyl esterase/lipase